MPNNRIAGIINVQTNGTVQDAVGDFTYNMGYPKRETLLGADRAHGFKEEPQVAFIEGELRDSRNLDLKALVTQVDVTVTLELANGKTLMLSDGWFASEGDVNTGEANIAVRWESRTPLEEIAP